MDAESTPVQTGSIKPIATVVEDLFKSNLMPDKFYESLIAAMKTFDIPNRVGIVDWFDIYKWVCRDVGLDANYTDVKEYLRECIVRMFRDKRKTIIIKLDALIREGVGAFDIDELERSNPTNYTHYTSFTVYGCPSSTDIDVAVFCPDTAKDNGAVKPLYDSEKRRLRSELTSIGYDPEAELDVNLMVVDAANGRIAASTKGGVETANIINATHMHHVQLYPFDLMGLKTVELNQEMFETKVASLSKFIWDYLKYCIPKIEYKRIHDQRSDVYQKDQNVMMRELRTVTPMLITDPAIAQENQLDMAHWRSVHKTVTMKLVQIIYFDLYGSMSYTKDGIAADASKILEQTPSELFTQDSIRYACEFYLFRGTKGVYHPSLFSYLIEIYFQIVDRITDSKSNSKRTYVSQQIMQVVQDLMNSTSTSSIELLGVPIEILDLFLQSPKLATPEFEHAWTSFANGRTVNEVFIKKVSDVGNCQFSPRIAQIVEEKMIVIPQRTPEWIELLTFYKCGNNGAEIGDDFQAQYNLIRGSIVEALCPLICKVLTDPETFRDFVMSCVPNAPPELMSDVGELRLINLDVGFVVEEIGRRGARGAAPDQLLVVETVDRSYIIPVEMKALKAGSDQAIENTDYRRGVSLARRQVQSIKEILGHDAALVPFGIIILSWIYDGQLVMDVVAEPF